MKLIVVELNTSAELDDTECAEVASAELIDDTDHSSGHGRWMERSHDGRREYERGHAAQERRRRRAARAGAAPMSSACKIHPATASGGAQHRATLVTWASG
jgi:hypothetical protein